MKIEKIAVLLSGNGVFDGAEINEAVLTLLAIEESGLEYQAFAPNRDLHHVINHMTGEEMQETRNIMVEAARITRGSIQPVTECKGRCFPNPASPNGTSDAMWDLITISPFMSASWVSVQRRPY
ncbi:hypothetical protein ACTG13_07945 [Aeromonas hydrophila]|uniref:hypothetical protein n=1 Tax=Aeromonas hydrophila TaxID=644 RepID=UPI003F798CED